MRPVQTALIIAGAFLVVSVAYILTSDWLALELTTTAEELRDVQSIKGAIYVAVVAFGLFGLTYALLRRIDAQMAELQAEREAILGAERRTLAGTLAASMAHDVNNLVGAIQANVDYAISLGELDDESRSALQDAMEATERLIELNRRLLKAAKRKTGEAKETTSLNETIEEAIEMIRTHSKLGDCRLETVLGPRVELRVYPDLVTHAVINLVLNAAEAAAPNGRIRVSLETAADTVVLSVEDDGPGVPEDQREQILSPFFTTKNSGTGLGLFSVAYCADEHGGDLEVGTSEMGGARMTIGFPVEQTPSPRSGSRGARPTLFGPGEPNPRPGR